MHAASADDPLQRSAETRHKASIHEKYTGRNSDLNNAITLSLDRAMHVISQQTSEPYEDEDMSRAATLTIANVIASFQKCLLTPE